MVIRMFAISTLLIAALWPQTGRAMAWPPAPQVQAKAWTLIDARSGQVLTQQRENLELPPASLTKMMTLYLAFEDIKLGRLDPGETVTVSKKAWEIGGSRMFIEPRLHPTVEELLHGIATLSGNDACIALAEHIAGSEEAFVERMNAKAKEMGLAHTRFRNATGYPEQGHYSSPMDMARLGAALWHDFPDRYALFAEKSYTYNGITQPNRNRLLWSDPRVDGIKTGHTEDAGYCLVSSAQIGDTRLVTSVFGADSEEGREQQSRLLLNYGFRNFVSMRPAERDIRRQVEVFRGKEDQVWLTPAREVWITVPKGYEEKIRFRLRYAAPLMAPVAKGQPIGSIEAVLVEGKEASEVLATVDMLAASAVPEASWIGKLWDSMRLWWRDSGETQAQP